MGWANRAQCQKKGEPSTDVARKVKPWDRGGEEPKGEAAQRKLLRRTLTPLVEKNAKRDIRSPPVALMIEAQEWLNPSGE